MPRTVLLLPLLVTLAACEWTQPRDEAEPAPVVSLAVETPAALEWGGTGTIRVVLANEGETTADGGIVEVHVPEWLEFGRVEPAGTTVMVVSGDSETRLAYQLTDSIAPGERRVITQHLRVRQEPPAAAVPPADTIETVQLAPANQVVRARLLNRAGAPAGAEVHATLHFVGQTGTVPPMPPGAGGLPADTLSRPQPADTAGAAQRRDTTAASG